MSLSQATLLTIQHRIMELTVGPAEKWWCLQEFSNLPWIVYCVLPGWTGDVPTAQAQCKDSKKDQAAQGARARQAAMAAKINRPPTPEAEQRELSMEDLVQLKVLCFALKYCSPGQAMKRGPNTDTEILLL